MCGLITCCLLALIIMTAIIGLIFFSDGAFCFLILAMVLECVLFFMYYIAGREENGSS